jgi:hypothetical protein
VKEGNSSDKKKFKLRPNLVIDMQELKESE